MKKDVVVALAVGFIIGTAAALTATNLPVILQSIKVPTVRKTPSPTAQLTLVPENPQLTIDAPADESISDTKTADLSGTAKPGQTVLIETPDDQKGLETDSSGKFTSKINLFEGVNMITVTVYDANGNASTKTINVYYTSEKL